MSDLFHEDVPLEYIQQVFDVMNRAHWHQYQVLTKRAERLEELSAKLPWARTSGWASASRTQIHRPHRPPAANRRTREVPVARTAARPAPEAEPARHPLGDRRRRIGPGRPADGPGLGDGHPRPVPRAPMSRSSSSNGAAFRRARPAGRSKAGRGTRCPNSTR